MLWMPNMSLDTGHKIFLFTDSARYLEGRLYILTEQNEL